MVFESQRLKLLITRGLFNFFFFFKMNLQKFKDFTYQVFNLLPCSFSLLPIHRGALPGSFKIILLILDRLVHAIVFFDVLKD